MKVVVFSDVHGKREIADRILAFNPDADYVISLGDSELDNDYFFDHDIVFVKGNYPRDPGFTFETDLQIGDLKFFLTHGHKFKVHRSLDNLIKHAIEEKYDVVLYGHTHMLDHQKYANTWFINPGSANNPRNSYPPSYLILNITGKKVQLTYKEALTNRTIEA